MHVTITLQHLGHGGHDDRHGRGPDRWPLIAERLASVDTDILLLNEANRWDVDDYAKLNRAASDLGLTAFPLPPSQSGYYVAMLYRQDRLGQAVDYNTDFASEFTHGIAMAAWDLGLPRPFAALVSHLSPLSPTKAHIEAEILCARASRYGGPYSVIGADFNYPPLYGPPADVSRMRSFNIARRFKDPLADTPRIPNTDVAQIMADNRFHDAFALLHQATGDPQLLRPTGRTDRIDWFVVTDPLSRAVVFGRLLDTPATASAHHGVTITIDLDLVDTTKPQDLNYA